MNSISLFFFVLQCPKLATKLVGFHSCDQLHIAISFNPNFHISFAVAVASPPILFCCYGFAHRHSSGCDGSPGGFLSASFCLRTGK